MSDVLPCVDIFFFLLATSLSVGSVWVNSHSVLDPCMPVSGHKDSGTCTDGGQEVGFYSSSQTALQLTQISHHTCFFFSHVIHGKV